MNTETKYELDEEWIEQRVAEYPTMSTEQITEWFTESIEKLKSNGLDITLGEDVAKFNSIVKTLVVSKIQENITVEPTDFNIMMLGPYPQRNMGKKICVEMIGFASRDDGNPDISSILAWDDFTTVKNDIEPLESYQTGVSLDTDDRKLNPKRYRLTVQKSTEFSDNTKYDMMGLNYDQKLESIRAGVPNVDLGEAGNNLSTLTPSSNGKSYPYPLDIKRVLVSVVGTDDGVDKTRREWAMYQVVDGTFKPSIKVKSVPVWVDPSIFKRLNAGKDSLLEIYGMIQQRDDGQISITACFIHPIVVIPLEPKDNQIQTDQQPQVVFNIMKTSDGM